jgi:TrmH family RNA methyltransferase
MVPPASQNALGSWTTAPPITSRANPRVRQLRAAVAGNSRLANGLVAIEGDHLIEEALRSGQPLKTVFLSGRLEPPAFLPRGVELICLSPDVFASCTETRSPQGIAALLVPPAESLEAMLQSPVEPLLLIAVGLQDPGNLGTLIRSAEAFGASGVLTTPGSVSPWNGKCVRASAGSVFRMPLALATSAAMERLEQAGVHLLASLKDDAAPIEDALLTGPCAFLIGKEGSGLDPGWLAMADARVTIPCPGRVESLNAAVAGSLLLYEASRQRLAAAHVHAAGHGQAEAPGPRQ